MCAFILLKGTWTTLEMGSSQGSHYGWSVYNEQWILSLCAASSNQSLCLCFLWNGTCFQSKHRQIFRTRETTRDYAQQLEDWSGRQSVQRFVWAFEKNKNVQLNHNRLIYYGANYVKITTKWAIFMYIFFRFSCFEYTYSTFSPSLVESSKSQISKSQKRRNGEISMPILR